jgi:hypothetical protein
MPIRRSVKHTLDFDRVAALPRRTLTIEDARAWAAALTPDLRKHAWDTTTQVRPWQAMSLVEVEAKRGGCLFLPVGVGKTLIFDLLPVVLGSKRPVIIMSATLRSKTWKDFAAHSKVWKRSRHPWTIVSREALARDENEDLLFRLAPDLVVLEESDDFANLDAAAIVRLDRYRVATWDDPDVVFAAFSGTPSRMSIMAYWHLLVWCLRDGAPVPLDQAEAETWANSLDESVRNESARMRPGPLGHSRDSALGWYLRRIAETPGVVIVDGDSCNAPLTVRTRLPREDAVLDKAFEHFTKYGETPGGVQVEDESDKNPLSKFRLESQIGIGICSYWDPPPPAEWRMAYRAKAKFVRETIARTRRLARGKRCDTAGQVVKRYPDVEPVREWRRIEEKYRDAFATKVEWLSDSGIASVKDWLAESREPGIVWCGSVEFARKLARATHLVYYGRMGRSEGGAELHSAPTGKSIICSWNANKKGFNLQAWTRALIVMPPQSAKWIEQIIGRIHRSGQESAVTVDVLLGSGATIDMFETALREARFARDSVGLTQKILRATLVRAQPRITHSNRFRWATRDEKEEEKEWHSKAESSTRIRDRLNLKPPRAKANPRRVRSHASLA